MTARPDFMSAVPQPCRTPSTSRAGTFPRSGRCRGGRPGPPAARDPARCGRSRRCRRARRQRRLGAPARPRRGRPIGPRRRRPTRHRPARRHGGGVGSEIEPVGGCGRHSATPTRGGPRRAGPGRSWGGRGSRWPTPRPAAPPCLRWPGDGAQRVGLRPDHHRGGRARDRPGSRHLVPRAAARPAAAGRRRAARARRPHRQPGARLRPQRPPRRRGLRDRPRHRRRSTRPTSTCACTCSPTGWCARARSTSTASSACWPTSSGPTSGPARSRTSSAPVSRCAARARCRSSASTSSRG